MNLGEVDESTETSLAAATAAIITATRSTSAQSAWAPPGQHTRTTAEVAPARGSATVGSATAGGATNGWTEHRAVPPQSAGYDEPALQPPDGRPPTRQRGRVGVAYVNAGGPSRGWSPTEVPLADERPVSPPFGALATGSGAWATAPVPGTPPAPPVSPAPAGSPAHGPSGWSGSDSTSSGGRAPDEVLSDLFSGQAAGYRAGSAALPPDPPMPDPLPPLSMSLDPSLPGPSRPGSPLPASVSGPPRPSSPPPEPAVRPLSPAQPPAGFGAPADLTAGDVRPGPATSGRREAGPAPQAWAGPGSRPRGTPSSLLEQPFSSSSDYSPPGSSFSGSLLTDLAFPEPFVDEPYDPDGFGPNGPSRRFPKPAAEPQHGAASQDEYHDPAPHGGEVPHDGRASHGDTPRHGMDSFDAADGPPDGYGRAGQVLAAVPSQVGPADVQAPGLDLWDGHLPQQAPGWEQPYRPEVQTQAWEPDQYGPSPDERHHDDRHHDDERGSHELRPHRPGQHGPGHGLLSHDSLSRGLLSHENLSHDSLSHDRRSHDRRSHDELDHDRLNHDQHAHDDLSRDELGQDQPPGADPSAVPFGRTPPGEIDRPVAPRPEQQGNGQVRAIGRPEPEAAEPGHTRPPLPPPDGGTERAQPAPPAPDGAHNGVAAQPESGLPVASASNGQQRVLPRRVPSVPHDAPVPLVPSEPPFDPGDGSAERIATFLRRYQRPDLEPRPAGYDLNAMIVAVQSVPDVSEARLRWNPGSGGHTLRIEFIEGADEAAVTAQVARVLRDTLGLTAPPSAWLTTDESTLERPGTARLHPHPAMPKATVLARPPEPASPVPVSAAPVSAAPMSAPPDVSPLPGLTPAVPEQDAQVDDAAEAGTHRWPGSVQSGSGRSSTQRPGARGYGGVHGDGRTVGPSMIDARRGHPLPLPGRQGSELARVVLEHVQVTILGMEATVEVRLTVSGTGPKAGSHAIGRGQGPAVDAYLLRLAANAAGNAVDQVLVNPHTGAPGGRCFIEHVAVVPFAGCEVAVVVLILVYGAFAEQLVGSAMVAGDPRQAVVRATLSALNRRLESLLA